MPHANAERQGCLPGQVRDLPELDRRDEQIRCQWFLGKLCDPVTIFRRMRAYISFGIPKV